MVETKTELKGLQLLIYVPNDGVKCMRTNGLRITKLNHLRTFVDILYFTSLAFLLHQTVAYIWEKSSVAVLSFIVSRKNAFLSDATINCELLWHFDFVLSLFYWLQTSTSQMIYPLQISAAGVAFVARRWQWWGVGFIWNILSLLWAVEAVQLPTEKEMYRIIWSKTTALLLSTAKTPSLPLSLTPTHMSTQDKSHT